MYLNPKGIIRWTLPILASLLLVTSCTIQKRLFNKGYSIEWHKKFGTPNREKEITLVPVTDHAMPASDTLDLAVNVQQYPPVQNAEATLQKKPVQVLRTSFDDTISKENHLPTHEIVHSKPLTIEKPPKQPNPPLESTRETGMLNLSIAADCIEYATWCLLATLLLVLLANLITAAVMEYVFVILLVISITCTGSFLLWIGLYGFIGLCWLIPYWIHKLIYKRRKRKYDEWFNTNYPTNPAL